MVAHDVLAPPLLADAAATRAWLRRCGEQGLAVRVPVEVQCGPAGVRLGDVRIGVATNSLRATLDDTTLGSSIEDHLRDGEAALDGAAVLLVDGFWDDEDATLYVRAVVRAWPPGARPDQTLAHGRALD